MVNSRNIESQGRNSNRRLSNHFVKKEDREEVRVDAVELYNSLWSGCRLQLRVHRELGTTVTKAQAFHISKHPQRIKGWSREILRTDTQPHMTYRKNTTACSCRSERNIHSLGLAWMLELAVPTLTNWPDAHGWPECLIWNEWPHKIWTLDTIILRLSSQDHFAI